MRGWSRHCTRSRHDEAHHDSPRFAQPPLRRHRRLHRSDPIGEEGGEDYWAVLFHKGALLEDPKGILVQQTPNVQSARQVRFNSVQEVVKVEKTLKTYIRAAIEVERAGLEVARKKTADFPVPAELASNAKLNKAFAALTPGRQRAYLLHFAQPKKPETRIARIEKHAPRILEGLGLDDE